MNQIDRDFIENARFYNTCLIKIALDCTHLRDEQDEEAPHRAGDRDALAGPARQLGAVVRVQHRLEAAEVAVEERVGEQLKYLRKGLVSCDEFGFGRASKYGYGRG